MFSNVIGIFETVGAWLTCFILNWHETCVTSFRQASHFLWNHLIFPNWRDIVYGFGYLHWFSIGLSQCAINRVSNNMCHVPIKMIQDHINLFEFRWGGMLSKWYSLCCVWQKQACIFIALYINWKGLSNYYRLPAFIISYVTLLYIVEDVICSTCISHYLVVSIVICLIAVYFKGLPIAVVR